MKIHLSFVILLSVLVSSFFSCGKSVDVEGMVYSKHMIPMANVEVELELYKGSDYPDHSVDKVKTDEHGIYLIRKSLRKNRGYKIFCYTADSGSCRSAYLTRTSGQHVDLILNY